MSKLFVCREDRIIFNDPGGGGVTNKKLLRFAQVSFLLACT